MANIRISPKHGVNPSMGVCFYCGEDDGTIIQPGRLEGDAEAPRRAVWTKEPCPKCKGWMAQGIMLIEATGPESDNPNRTGRLWVVKQEAVERMGLPPAMLADVIQRRMAFIEPEVSHRLGLTAE